MTDNGVEVELPAAQRDSDGWDYPEPSQRLAGDSDGMSMLLDRFETRTVQAARKRLLFAVQAAITNPEAEEVSVPHVHMW